MAPHRILIFSLAYYPRFVSGAEAAVREITDRIAPTDIEFHMVTMRFDPADSAEERIGNVRVYRVGANGSYLSKILFIPRAALLGARLVRHERIDALWGIMTYMAAPIMLMRLMGVRLPFAMTLQDGDPYEKVFKRPFARIMAPLIDGGFRHATVFQVISQYLGTWPARRGYQGPVVVVHNGADPRDIDESVTEDEVRHIRAALGYDGTQTYLINTARLEHQKGYDTVIRALALLPSEFHFVLVGSGTEEAALRRLADELGVIKRTHFVGRVDRDTASAYRKAAHIFVAPSRSEGLGNAFLSAMATKMPVVATQEGGLAEFVWDPEHNPDREPTAWVVPKDDSEAIVRAITWIVAHPEEVAARANHARSVVLAGFEWHTIAQTMRTEIFSRLIQ